MTLSEATLNPLDVIESLDSQGEDIWESAVDAGIAASAQGDQSRWIIGDLALLVEKHYRDDRIGQFASAIKCKVATVRGYRTVCGFWDRRNSPRGELLESCPNLCWTHFKDATRLKDRAVAKAFLEEASDQDWSTDFAALVLNKRIGKPTPPQKLVDTETPVQKLDKCKVTFELLPSMAERLIDAAYEHRRVRVVIYEVKE